MFFKEQKFKERFWSKTILRKNKDIFEETF